VLETLSGFVASKADERLARCVEARTGRRRASAADVEKIRRKLRSMAPDQNASKVAMIARAMADPMRVAILKAIGSEGELCVCEVMVLINRSQPSASHHLGILREAGLIKESRRGKWVFYSLVDTSVLDAVRSLAQVAAPRC